MKKKMLSIIMSAVMSTAFIGQTALSVPFNADAISAQVHIKIANSDVTIGYVQVDDCGLFNNYVVQEHITFARNDCKKFRVFYEVNENIYYREIDTVPAFSFKGSAKEFAENYIESNNIECEITDIDMTGVDSIYQSAYADGFTIVFADSVPLSTRVKATADISTSVKNNKGLPVFMSISTANDKLVQNSSIRKGDVNLDGQIGLADALAILQYIANAEKYPLSDQALFNADIVGDGDGVTPLDALEIQKWDAFKII